MMSDRDPTPQEVDQHLRSHAMNLAMQIHGVSQGPGQIVQMGPNGATVTPYDPPTNGPRYIPTVKAILEDAKAIYEFIRGTGVVANLRKVEEVA